MTDIAQVRDALTELPELAALLPAMLVSRTPTAGATVRATPQGRAPMRLDIVDLTDQTPRHRPVLDPSLGGQAFWCDPDEMGILPYLWTWCRDLEADAYDYAPTVPAEPPTELTVSSCSAYLLELLDFASTRPQWDEFATGVLRTWRRARSAVGEEGRATRVTCNRCGAGTLERVGDQQLWRCTACERELAVQAVTLRQAAPMVGVPLRTLQRWAWRHLFDGIIEGGRTLYDLGDIRRVVAETRLRQGA